MHRDGVNPDDVKPEDVLCDYCGSAAWALGEPCVEGHRGSIICGCCLSIAYQEIVVAGKGDTAKDPCRMCLEHRDQPAWLGHLDPLAPICLRCIKQSSTALEKSSHWDWAKPTPS